MHVLIAEDDLISRKILTGLLAKFGHMVVAVSDGREALDLILGIDGPRLAILDWVMPGMDGVEVCRHVRRQETQDPPYIILLTARADEQSIVEGLDAGANDYLTKPYKAEELRARIGVGERMLHLQTDLNETRDRLAHEAMHDALTEVLNRRAVLGALSRELGRVKRQGSALSVGLCDIDHFKEVNDRFGHLNGDDVLRGFAAIIREQLRPYDLFGRYGGEEFLIVAPCRRGDSVLALYERICAVVADAKIPTKSGEKIGVTVSIGVAVTDELRSMDRLLADADEALYEAKSAGRNRVCSAPSVVEYCRSSGAK